MPITDLGLYIHIFRQTLQKGSIHVERSKFYKIIDDDSDDENMDEEEEVKSVNEEHEGGCV